MCMNCNNFKIDIFQNVKKKENELVFNNEDNINKYIDYVLQKRKLINGPYEIAECIPMDNLSEEDKQKAPFDLVGKTIGMLYIEGVYIEKYITNSKRYKGGKREHWQYVCRCYCNPNKVVIKPRDRLQESGMKGKYCKECSRWIIDKLRNNAKLFVGAKIGHLTINRIIEQEEKYHYLYECSCDCGNPNPIIVGEGILANEATANCGCDKGIFAIEEGKIYNQWFVEKIFKDGQKNKAICICQCCGQRKTIYTYNINDTNCDKRREKEKQELRERAKNKQFLQIPDTIENLNGRTYNYLYVEGYLGYCNYKRYWLCKCLLCGSEKYYLESTIKNNYTKSCGCVSSMGEQKILDFLKKENISFIPQYHTEKCKYKRDLFFDFLVYYPNSDKYFLLEFQGEQHYKAVSFGPNMTKEQKDNKFEENQLRDNIKRQYCKDNNIELLEIPYWDFDNIEKILADKLGIKLSEEELDESE